MNAETDVRCLVIKYNTKDICKDLNNTITTFSFEKYSADAFQGTFFAKD